MEDNKYLIVAITGVTGVVTGLSYIIYKAKKAPVELPEVVVTAPPEKPVTTGMVTISEGIADLITSGTTAAGTIFDKITETFTAQKPEPELIPSIETELSVAPGEPLPTAPTEPTKEVKLTEEFKAEAMKKGRDFRTCIYKGDRRATCFTMDNERWVLYRDENNEGHCERIE